MNLTPEKITELCDSWVAAVSMEGGGFAIGRESEQYRLFNNGVQFHDLEYESLIASISGLTKVLLLPGLNTVVDQDHFGLWSWCAEVILDRDTAIFSDDEFELRKLFETCIRASLVHCRKPVSSQEEWQKQIEDDRMIPDNLKYFGQEASLALAYLAFPLLEGISKKLCKDYVSMDGQVKQCFEVPGRGARPRIYDPAQWKTARCSSLRDLLLLIHNDVASEALKGELDVLKEHIFNLDDSADAFDTLYNWRNQSLHGSTNFQTIGGTLLNLSIMLLIDLISDGYADIRPQVLDRCRTNASQSFRSPWSYYPPY